MGRGKRGDRRVSRKPWGESLEAMGHDVACHAVAICAGAAPPHHHQPSRALPLHRHEQRSPLPPGYYTGVVLRVPVQYPPGATWQGLQHPRPGESPLCAALSHCFEAAPSAAGGGVPGAGEGGQRVEECVRGAGRAAALQAGSRKRGVGRRRAGTEALAGSCCGTRCSCSSRPLWTLGHQMEAQVEDAAARRGWDSGSEGTSKQGRRATAREGGAPGSAGFRSGAGVWRRRDEGGCARRATRPDASLGSRGATFLRGTWRRHGAQGLLPLRRPWLDSGARFAGGAARPRTCSRLCAARLRTRCSGWGRSWGP